MISHTHVETLREQVAQAQRVLAGWEQLLSTAEQQARAGQLLPDPLMPTGTPWPVPDLAPVERRQPYPASTSVMPAIDGSTLPPSQEAAIGTIWSEHDQHATSPKGVREDEKWRQA
ncbi:hypothetical protein AB0K05_24760 [Nonomuraea sp. NPDC049486]|uniref:hypothetical protein n=1 Tax=Nonomuraea sp. NPDC049486 TaxID=3155773 RepID=UPI003440D513